MSLSILAVELPEALRFLNWGWWGIHAVAIAFWFSVGFLVCRKCFGSAAEKGRKQETVD